VRGRAGAVLAALSLEPEHRRGHGAAYDAVNAGRIDIARLRWSLAALPLSAWPDGRIRLAVDVSNWLRPGAVTSPVVTMTVYAHVCQVASARRPTCSPCGSRRRDAGQALWYQASITAAR
jgi:hypothetical protein